MTGSKTRTVTTVHIESVSEMLCGGFLTMTEYEYPPGGDEALEKGCTCPVLDNNHGKGYMGTDRYVVRFDCPLHGEEDE